MNKRDRDGFSTMILVCRFSDSSYKSTDSSLVIVDYASCLSLLNLLNWHAHGSILRNCV